MGITGTEVSKEAAEMILTDDNFATIVTAVEVGRGLYDNLMKYLRFQMGVLARLHPHVPRRRIFNIAGGVPFLPLQTLWINFTTQVFQAVGLGYGKFADPRHGAQAARPASRSSPHAGCAGSAIVGLVMGVGTLVVVCWGDARTTTRPSPARWA